MPAQARARLLSGPDRDAAGRGLAGIVLIEGWPGSVEPKIGPVS